MAVIVRNEKNNQVYVLVGTSYSFYKDSRPSFLGGVLFPHEEEGLFNLVAVTDESGKIDWFPADEIKVIEVEGRSIKDILDNFKSQHNNLHESKAETSELDICPGCGFKLKKEDEECPSCGLNFVVEE